MVVYYSVYDAIERASGAREYRADCGWGRLVRTMDELLSSRGVPMIYDYGERDAADIEFYVGQPPLNLRPSMHPAVILSMFETTALPPLWRDSLNRWDAVINPSDWGCACFKESKVRVPIHKIPLPIDFRRFRFIERDLGDEWIYIAQGVQLMDRKNLPLVVEVFEGGKMPNDTRLIVKTIPKFGQPELDLALSPQVRLIQKLLSDEEYLQFLSAARVSVNPSSGEGFAYLPAESMATGLCTIMTDFSAMRDLLSSGCAVSVKCQVTPSKVFVTGGYDADIDVDDLREKMLWTYENREESFRMGAKAAAWIRRYCDPEKIFSSLISLFDFYIENVEKELLREDAPFVDFDFLRLGRR